LRFKKMMVREGGRMCLSCGEDNKTIVARYTCATVDGFYLKRVGAVLHLDQLPILRALAAARLDAVLGRLWEWTVTKMTTMMKMMMDDETHRRPSRF
jgi:hypothetical protein